MRSAELFLNPGGYTKSCPQFLSLSNILVPENFRLINHKVVDRMRPTFCFLSLIKLIKNVVGNLLGLHGINESAPKTCDVLMSLSGRKCLSKKIRLYRFFLVRWTQVQKGTSDSETAFMKRQSIGTSWLFNRVNQKSPELLHAIQNFQPITRQNRRKSMIREFLKDEQGQDIVEYSLLLVLIGAAAIFVLTTMGQSISSIFNKINTKLTTANNSIS